MGGWKKTQGRVPPRFMNEELCHRNMAFSLYQADEMPLMKAGEPTVEALGGGVHRVRVELTNTKLTPTILAKAAENNVVRPDLLTVSGQGVEVLSAGWVRDRFRPGATQLIDQKQLVAHPRAQRPSRTHHPRHRVHRQGLGADDGDLRQPEGRPRGGDRHAEIGCPLRERKRAGPTGERKRAASRQRVLRHSVRPIPVVRTGFTDTVSPGWTTAEPGRDSTRATCMTSGRDCWRARFSALSSPPCRA